jgi:hypothetical protein
VDNFKIPHGYWEDKDTKDDLRVMIRRVMVWSPVQESPEFNAPAWLAGTLMPVPVA